jgi:hypothetical protein
MRLPNALLAFVVSASEAVRDYFVPGPSRPKMISPKNRWYWTRAWQQAEREADSDLVEGRYEDFDTIDHVIAVMQQNAMTDPPEKVDRLAAALRRLPRRRQGR